MFASKGETPVKTRAGKVRKLPPPATELSAPATSDAITNVAYSTKVMGVSMLLCQPVLRVQRTFEAVVGVIGLSCSQTLSHLPMQRVSRLPKQKCSRLRLQKVSRWLLRLPSLRNPMQKQSSQQCLIFGSPVRGHSKP